MLSSSQESNLYYDHLLDIQIRDVSTYNSNSFNDSNFKLHVETIPLVPHSVFNIPVTELIYVIDNYIVYH